MAKLELQLLGGFRLSGPKGKLLALTGKKAQALLAYLALNPGVHLREKLADLLWGDRMDEQARHSLRQALSSVRKALGDGDGNILVADQETVELEGGRSVLREQQGSGSTTLLEIESQTLVNLGENHLMLGDLDLAQEILEERHAKCDEPLYGLVRQRWQVRLLCALGELWLARDDPARAQEFHHAVRAHGWADQYPFLKYQVRGGG